METKNFRVPPRSILALKCVLEPSIGGCVSKKTQIYRLAYTESQYIKVSLNQKKLISKFLKEIEELISNFCEKMKLKNN